MTIVLTLVSLLVCFGIAYWLAGWLLAFLVVSQSALISFGVLVCLACIAMALVVKGERGNRWWAGVFIAIIICVGLEYLEPYVGVIRVVLAAAGSIWATVILYRTVIRRIGAQRRQQNAHQNTP